MSTTDAIPSRRQDLCRLYKALKGADRQLLILIDPCNCQAVFCRRNLQVIFFAPCDEHQKTCPIDEARPGYVRWQIPERLARIGRRLRQR